ncbi:MAG: DUF3836 domain-containing protein [Bacteroidales bacterium]|nr:DUF3836 domain-containing protein [Bacteroidales bacterium]
MKTLVLSAMMCLAAMTSTAQVITSDIVNISYLSVATSSDGQYAYNVECNDNDYITTMYVYKKNVRMNGDIDLKPSCRYQYEYAADGMLLSRTTYVWYNNGWQCTGRLSYSLNDDLYCVEFSRWNPKTANFDKASEMMTYTLEPDYTAYNVSWFLRNHRGDSYKLSWQVSVSGQSSGDPYLLAKM